MKSGEFRIDSFTLKNYKAELEREHALIFSVTYQFATKQNNEFFILVVHPSYTDIAGYLMSFDENKDEMLKKYSKLLKRIQKSKVKESKIKSA